MLSYRTLSQTDYDDLVVEMILSVPGVRTAHQMIREYEMRKVI